MIDESRVMSKDTSCDSKNTRKVAFKHKTENRLKLTNNIRFYSEIDVFYRIIRLKTINFYTTVTR